MLGSDESGTIRETIGVQAGAGFGIKSLFRGIGLGGLTVREFFTAVHFVVGDYGTSYLAALSSAGTLQLYRFGISLEEATLAPSGPGFPFGGQVSGLGAGKGQRWELRSVYHRKSESEEFSLCLSSTGGPSKTPAQARIFVLRCQNG